MKTINNPQKYLFNCVCLRDFFFFPFVHILSRNTHQQIYPSTFPRHTSDQSVVRRQQLAVTLIWRSQSALSGRRLSLVYGWFSSHIKNTLNTLPSFPFSDTRRERKKKWKQKRNLWWLSFCTFLKLGYIFPSFCCVFFSRSVLYWVGGAIVIPKHTTQEYSTYMRYSRV